jgi:glycosyltransferase 2 family protein
MKRVLRHLSQLLPAVVALTLFSFTLRTADIGRALGLVSSLGGIIPLLLLPSLVATVLEALGWWLAFSRLGGRPRFRSLLAVRFMVDAVMQGLPSGAVISESLQPYLLKRRCGVPFETGIIAGIGRKFLVVLSHGLFLTGSIFLAWPTLERASHAAIHRGGLPWLLLAIATTLVTLSIATAAVSAHGRLGDRALRTLNRFGGRWLGTWLERNALRFQRADEHLSTFFSREPAGLVPPLAAYALGWFARAVETLVFLRLLGVSVALSSTMVMETALILVRALAVPVPAGLGFQDAGYVLSLKGLAVPDATTVGAAFVLLKRGKDLFWIGFGFLLLLLTREAGEGAIPTRPEGPGEVALSPGDGPLSDREGAPAAPARPQSS